MQERHLELDLVLENINYVSIGLAEFRRNQDLIICRKNYLIFCQSFIIYDIYRVGFYLNQRILRNIEEYPQDGRSKK